MSYEPRLKIAYRDEILPALMKEQGYKNYMAVPRLVKITVNQGLGRAVVNKNILEIAQGELAHITGQRPLVTQAKKSIAGFKLREGMPIGLKVTLRRDRMYEFMDKLVSVSLPRVRDFRGISLKSFDGRGNYTLGLKEQIIFPEIDVDHVDHILGMDITFVTTAESDKEAHALLKAMGMPFRKDQQN